MNVIYLSLSLSLSLDLITKKAAKGQGAYMRDKRMIHILGRREWDGVTFHDDTQNGM